MTWMMYNIDAVFCISSFFLIEQLFEKWKQHLGSSCADML